MAAPSGSRSFLMLLIAVLIGAAAAGLTILYIKNREAQIRESLAGPREERVAVVVPTRDIAKGERVSTDKFAVREIPVGFAHADAIHPAAFERIAGRFIIQPLRAGTALLLSHLDDQFPIDFSDSIKEGRRAVTVQVDELQTFSGMIRPGNRVDLFVNIQTKVVGFKSASLTGQIPQPVLDAALQSLSATGTVPDAVREALAGETEVTAGTPQEVIVPVLQNVMVLAVADVPYQDSLDSLGRPQGRPERRATNLTLDVDSEEGALLSLAADKGDLLALLRNRRDGTLATFDGITPFDLVTRAAEMSRKAALQNAAAAAGATINENGDWVMADGTVIAKEDIVIDPETGTVTTRDGKLIAAKGLRRDENGNLVDANGNVVKEEDLVRRADGTYVTKEQALDAAMAAAGYTKTADGLYVDAQGNVVDPADVQVLANGSVVNTRTGETVAGPKVTVTKDGFYVDENGRVMSANGDVLEGVRVDENGNVVTASGEVLTDPNLRVTADGQVVDAKGRVVKGVTSGSAAAPKGTLTKDGFYVDENGRVLNANGEVLHGVRVDANGDVVTLTGRRLTDPNITAQGLLLESLQAGEAEQALAGLGADEAAMKMQGIEMIIGGKSKDGVAKVGELPVLE